MMGHMSLITASATGGTHPSVIVIRSAALHRDRRANDSNSTAAPCASRRWHFTFGIPIGSSFSRRRACAAAVGRCRDRRRSRRIAAPCQVGVASRSHGIHRRHASEQRGGARRQRSLADVHRECGVSGGVRSLVADAVVGRLACNRQHSRSCDASTLQPLKRVRDSDERPCV